MELKSSLGYAHISELLVVFSDLILESLQCSWNNGNEQSLEVENMHANVQRCWAVLEMGILAPGCLVLPDDLPSENGRNPFLCRACKTSSPSKQVSSDVTWWHSDRMHWFSMAVWVGGRRRGSRGFTTVLLPRIPDLWVSLGGWNHLDVSLAFSPLLLETQFTSGWGLLALSGSPSHFLTDNSFYDTRFYIFIGTRKWI